MYLHKLATTSNKEFSNSVYRSLRSLTYSFHQIFIHISPKRLRKHKSLSIADMLWLSHMHYQGDLLTCHWNPIHNKDRGIICMRSFMSMHPKGKPPTTKSYIWRRMPIDVCVKARYNIYDSYCPNSFLVCLGIQFVYFFYLIWTFEPSTLLIIGDWWLL